MIRYWINIFIGLTILFFGCEYEPAGIYESDLKFPEYPKNAIIDIDYIDGPDTTEIDESDTLWVRYDNSLAFDVSTYVKGHEIYDVRYSINGYELESIILLDYQEEIDRSTRNLVVESNKMRIGINKVTVVMYVNTNSNSIMNTIDAETFVYAKSFYVDKFADEVQVTYPLSLKVENGMLKIEWDKYNYPDFNYYLVDRISKKITEKDSTYFYHPSFIEEDPADGTIDFEVYADGSPYAIVSTSLTKKYSIPELKYEIQDDAVLFHWNKTRFYNMAVKYQLHNLNMSTGRRESVFYETTDVNDTTYLMSEPLFGMSFGMELLFLKQNDVADWAKVGKRIPELTIGETIPEKVNWFDLYDIATDKLIFVDDNKVYKYSEETNEIESTSTGEFPYYRYNSSVNRTKFIASGTIHFTVFDIATLDYKYYSSDDVDKIKNLIGVTSSYKIQVAFIDESGYIYLSFVDYYGTGQPVFIKYDPVNNTYIKIDISDETDILEWHASNGISENGRYAVIGYGLYEISGTTATKINIIKGGYFISNSNKIVCDENFALKYFDTNTGTFGESVCTYQRLYSISPKRDYAVIKKSSTDTYCSLIEVNTGTILRSNISSDCYVINGGYLFGPNHRRIAIKK